MTNLVQPGPNEFVDLSDTPDTYTGHNAKVVSVKTTEDGVEFVATASSLTFYVDSVSGTIDGSNTTFTVSNTITSALALFLAGQPYQLTEDYTVSGTTITMVVAPHQSLSGQPFWLLHT